MSVLKKSIVLELNAHWQRTKWRTVEDAIVALCIDRSGIPNMLAIPVGPDGIEGHPINFDEWVKLPVRECDLSISTKNGAIRVPLAIIAPGYAQMRLKAPVLSREGIYTRDGLIDQYTGEQLTREEANIDHVIPQDVWHRRGLSGSPHRWENMVTTRRERNFKKGNKTNHQAGLKLLKKPKAPKAVPVHFLIRKPHHAFQLPFFQDIHG